MAQINLCDLSNYDNGGLLPNTGNLYFFQGPMIDNTYYECGKVICPDNEKENKIFGIYMVKELFPF